MNRDSKLGHALRTCHSVVRTQYQVRRSPSVRLGLTLMEVIIALGLTAIISILVMGLLIRLLTTSGASSHQTTAAILAHEILETATAAGPPTWGFGSTDQTLWTGTRELLLPGDETETEFQFQLEALTLRDSPDDLGTVHQLKATVWWWGDEPGYRAEQGRTSVDAVRTVYVRK